MKIEIIEKDIRECVAAEVEKVTPSIGWWNSAIFHANEQKRRGFWSKLIPKTRLAWALAPLIFLLFAGAVYGAVSGVQHLFEALAPDVERAGLSTVLNMSQTVNGVTVTLERAYADSNIILIGYSIDKPREKTIFWGKLVTSDGQELKPMIGMGVVPDKELGFSDNAMIFGYDASTLSSMPAELNLKLEVSPQPFADAPMQEASELFTFNFILPFHAGKEIDVNQTVDAAGIPVTLEKVVISHYATRVVLHTLPEYNNSFVNMSLQFNDSDSTKSKANLLSITYNTEDTQSAYFPGDFISQQGEGKLIINEMIIPGNDSNGDTRLSGPWIIRFNVP